MANDRGLQESFNDLAAPWLDKAVKASCTAAATHHATDHVKATNVLHFAKHDQTGTVYSMCNPVTFCDKSWGKCSGSAAREDARVAHAKPTVVEPGMAPDLDPSSAPGDDEGLAPDCALNVRAFHAPCREPHDDQRKVPRDVNGKDTQIEQYDTPKELDDLVTGELSPSPSPRLQGSVKDMILQGIATAERTGHM